MIVTCSNCQTKFLVDEQLLLPHGRDVACNRCHNQWFQPKPTHLAQQQPHQSNQIPSNPPPSAEPNLQGQQAHQGQSQAPQEQVQSQQDSAIPTWTNQPPNPNPQSVAQPHSKTPFTSPPDSPPVRPQAEMTRQDITQRLAHIRESVQSQSAPPHSIQPNAHPHSDKWDSHAPPQQNIPPFINTPPHGAEPPYAHSPYDQSSSVQQQEAFTHPNRNPMVPVKHEHLQNTRSWGKQMFVLLFVALLLAGVIALVTKDKIISTFPQLQPLVNITATSDFNKIISTFPQLQPYYQMLGIETQGINKALSILEPTAKIETKGGQSVLMISGVVENPHNQAKPVPLLMAQVKDGQGVVLNQWTFKATAETIPPRGSVTYTTSIANPSERAEQVAVKIATPQNKNPPK